MQLCDTQRQEAWWAQEAQKLQGAREGAGELQGWARPPGRLHTPLSAAVKGLRAHAHSRSPLGGWDGRWSRGGKPSWVPLTGAPVRNALCLGSSVVDQGADSVLNST